MELPQKMEIGGLFCLPRTTERPVRKRGNEFSDLPVTLWSNLSTETAHVSAGYDSTGQSHGRKSVVRGLPAFFT